MGRTQDGSRSTPNTVQDEIVDKLRSVASNATALAALLATPLPPMVASKLLLDLARIDGELAEHKHRIPT